MKISSAVVLQRCHYLPLPLEGFSLAQVSLFILVSKVTPDLKSITNSVNLSKIKPVATELSQTYDHIAVGRKESYQTVGSLQEFNTDLSEFPIFFLKYISD